MLITDTAKHVALGKAFITEGGKHAELSKAFVTENGVNSLLWSDGGVFLVASSSTVFSTDDGKKWKSTANTGFQINEITYGNGMFVAVGSNGVVGRSTDNGTTWGTIVIDGHVYLKGVAYGNGKFIAVGYDASVENDSKGRAYVSTDAINWTRVIYGGYSLYCVAYGNGKYVIGGDKDMHYSTDGTKWASVRLDYSNNMLAFGNGVFVLSSSLFEIFTSTDGSSWVHRKSLSPWYMNSLTFGQGKFVAACYNDGKSAGYYSTDGIKWTEGTSLDVRAIYSGMCYGNGIFLTTSYEGMSCNSVDGINWNILGGLIKDTYFTGAYYACKYIIIGGTNAYYSSDGIDWIRGSYTFPHRMYAMSEGLGRLVSAGTYNYSQYTIDSNTWTAMAGLSTGTGTSTIKDMVFQDKFVAAMADGNVAVSTNGTTWSRYYVATNRGIEAVAYGVGRYVAIGQYGSVFYSTNGTSWTTGIPSSNYYYTVAYGNGRFVAVGLSGAVGYSLDGITWTAGTKPNTSWNARCVKFAFNKFIACGDDGLSYYSVDGANWTSMPGLATTNYYSLVFYNNVLIAATGNGSTLRNSTNGTSWSAIPDYIYGSNKSTISFSADGGIGDE